MPRYPSAQVVTPPPRSFVPLNDLPITYKRPVFAMTATRRLPGVPCSTWITPRLPAIAQPATTASRRPAKSVNHIATSEQCDNCHQTNGWIPAFFDHINVTGNCVGCHNGIDAVGKSASHIQTTTICEDCHTTDFFAPVVTVDHTQVIGTCSSCHNGTIAIGKHPSHITSGDTCDDCHTTNGWVPANFDHVDITGNCFSCHNGTEAIGKNPTHIQTTNICEDCHNSVLFAPADRVDHTQVIGTCGSCHNGTIAMGKHPTHIQWRQLRRLPYDDWLDTGILRPRECCRKLHQLPQRRRCDRQESDTYPDDQRLRGLPQQRYVGSGGQGRSYPGHWLMFILS